MSEISRPSSQNSTRSSGKRLTAEQRAVRRFNHECRSSRLLELADLDRAIHLSQTLRAVDRRPNFDQLDHELKIILVHKDCPLVADSARILQDELIVAKERWRAAGGDHEEWKRQENDRGETLGQELKRRRPSLILRIRTPDREAAMDRWLLDREEKGMPSFPPYHENTNPGSIGPAAAVRESLPPMPPPDEPSNPALQDMYIPGTYPHGLDTVENQLSPLAPCNAQKLSMRMLVPSKRLWSMRQIFGTQKKATQEQLPILQNSAYSGDSGMFHQQIPPRPRKNQKHAASNSSVQLASASSAPVVAEAQTQESSHGGARPRRGKDRLRAALKRLDKEFHHYWF